MGNTIIRASPQESSALLTARLARGVGVDPARDGGSRSSHHIEVVQADGAHAAAAEQYAHYAAAMRSELGLDPPELDDL
jgi:hypothetical protein